MILEFLLTILIVGFVTAGVNIKFYGDFTILLLFKSIEITSYLGAPSI